MHMLDKLQLHFGLDAPEWSDGPAGREAAWDGHLVRAIEGPVTAAMIVDAHAAKAGRAVTLAHAGPVSDVARRAAARFGIELLDVTLLPAPAAEGADVLSVPDGFFDAFDRTLVQQALEHAASEALLLPTADEVEADLEALVGALDAELAEPTAVATAGPAPELPDPAPPAPLIEGDVQLPWDPAVAAPIEAAPPIEISPLELIALPWSLGEDDPVEMLPAGRETRGGPRPTLIEPNWGLPWPRPPLPADGLAVADPTLWRMHERTLAMRDRYDAAGGGSFGAVKNEPASWLKKVQTLG